MNIQIEQRVLKEAESFKLYKDATVRSIALNSSVSKSTVHKDLTAHLPIIDNDLYLEIRNKLDINKNERHIRGGEATKQKYLLKQL